MLQVNIEASKREGVGKGAARSLRRSGRTPAVLYGLGMSPQSLSLDTRDFTKALLSVHQRNAVLNLDVDKDKGGVSYHVLTREIQTDPIVGDVLHADFYQISLDEPMTFAVPLRFKGKAKGVELGGELEVYLNELTLKGKALDIPDFVEVDVADLGSNSGYKCSDIQLAEGVELVSSPDKVCVAVVGGTE